MVVNGRISGEMMLYVRPSVKMSSAYNDFKVSPEGTPSIGPSTYLWVDRAEVQHGRRIELCVIWR